MEFITKKTSNKLSQEFAFISLDFNRLHRSGPIKMLGEQYKVKNTRPIVPGMFLVTYQLAKADELFPKFGEQGFHARFYFGNPIISGDSIDFGILEHENIILLSAKNMRTGKDALSKGGKSEEEKNSFINLDYKVLHDITPPHHMGVSIPEGHFERFRKMISRGGTVPDRYLYHIALSSGVTINACKEGFNDAFKEVHTKMNSGYVPAYTSIDIFFKDGFDTVKNFNNPEFFVNAENKGKRGYSTELVCVAGNEIIYSLKSNITMISEGTLFRAMK